MTLGDGFPAASGTVDSTELRKALAGLILRDTSGNARAGVFPRHTSALVSAKASMAVDVAAFEGCTVRGGGPIFLANDGTVAVSIDAAPVSNSRIDVAYFKQNESASPYSDANDLPVIAVEKGTAGAVPVKPSLPDGAVELATILIPSGVSATNAGGVVITQTAPFTTVTGGVLLVRSTADLSALPSFLAETRVRVIGEAFDREYRTSAWLPLMPRVPVNASAVTVTGSGSGRTIGSDGTGTVTAAATILFEDILPVGAKRARLTLWATTVTVAGAVQVQVGSGGTPVTSGVYGWHAAHVGTATTSSSGNDGTDTSATLARVESAGRIVIEVSAADMAEWTIFESVSIDGSFRWAASGAVKNTTAYTDLKLTFTNSSRVTGRWLVEAEF